MENDFKHDVFLSHNQADKLRVWRMFCMSANAFGSDWTQLEAGAFGRGNLPFRGLLNKERRFIPFLLANYNPPNAPRWLRADNYQELYG